MRIPHRWLKLQFGYYSDPRPVLGTVSTLVQTGDIKLIDSPILRSGITAYLSLMQADLDEPSRNVGRQTGASDIIRRRWESNSLPPLVLPRFTSASLLPDQYTDAEATEMLPRFMRAWPVIKSDPEMRAAEQTRLMAYANRVFYFERMLASSIQLSEMLPPAR